MSEETVNDRAPNFRDLTGRIYLLRCFSCEPVRGLENWELNVSLGVCYKCGWPHHETV